MKSLMIFNRKKKVKDLFNQSFGQVKEETFNFDLIERYFRKKDNSRELQTLSDKTCNDLDFEELFLFIDRTNSKVGQQYLYNRLRTIPQASHEFSLQERILKEFEKTPELRLDVQTLLARLNEQDTYYISSLFQHEHTKPPKWFFIIKFLSFANLLSIIMLIVNIKIILVIFAITIINTGIHYWNKKNLYQYLGSVPQLLRLNSIARKLFENESFKELDPTLNKSLAEIDKVRNRMHFFNLESKLQSDTEIFFTTIL